MMYRSRMETETPAAYGGLYHGLGYGKHVLYGLGVRGGTETIAPNTVDAIWTPSLVRQGMVTRDGDTYTLTPFGWDVFYAGTSYRRDYYGPRITRGVSA